MVLQGRIDRKVSFHSDEEGRHAILVLHAARLAVEIEPVANDNQTEDGKKDGTGDEQEDMLCHYLDLICDRLTLPSSARERGAVEFDDPLRLREIASKTVEFSGADLANLVNEVSMIMALQHNTLKLDNLRIVCLAQDG